MSERNRTRRNSCVEGRMLATADASEMFAVRARKIGAKPLAVALRTSYRTVENWMAGRAGPNWKHVATMLADDALACEVLRAAGRDDIADLVEMKSHADKAAAIMKRMAAE